MIREQKETCQWVKNVEHQCDRLRWVVWFIIVVDLMLLDDFKSHVMLNAKHC